MKEILKNGVTGLLVSHSVSQVRDLCNKVLWLDHGKQIAFGDAYDICNAYEHFLATPKKKQKVPKNMDEIMKISHQFQIYKILEHEEAVAKRKKPKDPNEVKETATQREQRLMRKVASMTPEELAPYEEELKAKHK